MVAIWLITILGALFGALLFAQSFTSANGAPQQAAGAAMACAAAVLPYVFARAIEKISQISKSEGGTSGRPKE
jgi:formate/nitrite transporter FocA (FNT family)